MGVAKSSFQRWVEGRSDPSFEGLSRLAEATGTSLDWLARGLMRQPMDFEIERQLLQREINSVRAVQLASGTGEAEREAAWEREKALYAEIERLEEGAAARGGLYRGDGAADTLLQAAEGDAGEEKKPFGDILSVPVLGPVLSSSVGSGKPQLRIDETLSLSASIVRSAMGRDTAEEVLAFWVRGESMSPSFRDGDLVLVDMSEREPVEAVMLIAFDERVQIKRLRFSPEGMLLISDDTRYPPIEFSADEFSRVLLLGRVRWRGGGVL